MHDIDPRRKTRGFRERRVPRRSKKRGAVPSTFGVAAPPPRLFINVTIKRTRVADERGENRSRGKSERRIFRREDSVASLFRREGDRLICLIYFTLPSKISKNKILQKYRNTRVENVHRGSKGKNTGRVFSCLTKERRRNYVTDLRFVFRTIPHFT